MNQIDMIILLIYFCL